MSNHETFASKRPFFKKTDIIIIAAILIVCAALVGVRYFTGSRSDALSAQIYSGDKPIKTVMLSKNEVFTLNGAEFEVKDGKIRFLSSDCPDKLCVNTGFIQNSGDVAVCLPKKLYIKIIGGDSAGKVDIIAD